LEAFKDNFSKQADIYSQFRPTYPKELFDHLQSLTSEHDLAWDCGTGNGQSAMQLIKFYEKVYATDPSEEQIKNAFPNEKIFYKVERAENSSLKDHSTDLITVAQAIHWFDFDRFYSEAKRVLKPKGIIAVWAYGIPSVDEKLDPVIKNFHDHTVGKFWLPENKLIENGYSTIPFPFEEISSPEFFIRKKLTLTELSGHFRSWSATQKYIDAYQDNPVELLKQRLAEHWKDKEAEKEVAWKLVLRIGKLI